MIGGGVRPQAGFTRLAVRRNGGRRSGIPTRRPALFRRMESSVVMSGQPQLVVSATVSSMLTSLSLGRIPRYSAATGHEPVLGPDRGTEVDARARAAVLRAAPTNRELTVRADRRERAEELRQARHGRAEDDVQVAVHVQTITTTFKVLLVRPLRKHQSFNL